MTTPERGYEVTGAPDIKSTCPFTSQNALLFPELLFFSRTALLFSRSALLFPRSTFLLSGGVFLFPKNALLFSRIALYFSRSTFILFIARVFFQE